MFITLFFHHNYNIEGNEKEEVDNSTVEKEKEIRGFNVLSKNKNKTGAVQNN